MQIVVLSSLVIIIIFRWLYVKSPLSPFSDFQSAEC